MAPKMTNHNTLLSLMDSAYSFPTVSLTVYIYNVSLEDCAGRCQEVFGRIFRKLLSVLARLDVALVYFRGSYFQSITATLPVEVPGLNGARHVVYPIPL